MRKCLGARTATVILLGLVVAGAARAQDVVWVRQFGSPDQDYAFGLWADAGGVYVVGCTQGALPGQMNQGRRDAYVRKYDTEGNELWTTQFGTAMLDGAYGVCADASGVYVAGWLSGVFRGEPNGELQDAFLRKYDADGNELWDRRFAAGVADGAVDVCADATGVYVAGYVRGAWPGQANAGMGDSFIAKYSAAGDELWARQFGTAVHDTVGGVCVDDTGAYVAGYSRASDTAEPGEGKEDGFVVKCDGDGNRLWSTEPGSAPGASVAKACVDATGVYVVGHTTRVPPGPRAKPQYDAYVRKYDADGKELWLRPFATAASDGAFDICADASGVYAVGHSTPVPPAPNALTWPNGFVRKYGADGRELWTKWLATRDADVAQCVAAGPGAVYVAGNTWGTLPGQTNAGACDVFLARFSTGGPP